MLIKRALTALLFAPALLALVIIGGLPLKLTCVVLAWLMLWEFLRLTLGPGESYLKGLAFVLTTLLALELTGLTASIAELAGLAAPVSMQQLVAGIVLVLLTAVMLRPGAIERSLPQAALVALGIGYAGALIPFLARVRDLEQLPGSGQPGLALGLMAVFCTWGADTGAYLAGRTLGRHKLYPRVSPGKTIEGALGGVAAAVGVAFLIRWFVPTFKGGTVEISVLNTALIGVIVAVVGIVGDLAESLIKRSVGAKDSSGLIPGHGGVLDRFDAVMFVAPALHIFATLFVLGAAGR